MSGYFARLAQRSVSLAIAPRRAATASPGVDIVEQNTVVDAPVTAAPRLDAPMARSTTAEAPTPSSASPVSSTADMPSRNQGERAPLDRVDETQSPSAPIRGAIVERVSRLDEARPESSRASASIAPTVDASRFAPETGRRNEAPAATRADTAATEEAARKTTARAAMSDVREEGRARANDVPAPPSPSATIVPEPQDVTAGDRLRPRPRAGDIETRASPARHEDGQAGTRDVAVHIGAVRLEIHTPTPTSTAVPRTPPASNERPRFNPRRHFLRG